MPSYITMQMFLGSIVVGLMAGLITGVIGAGGGYVLTPAMMSIGVRGIMAVGTDQFHLFAKAIMGTVIHKKLGNVNLWIAVWFVWGP
jgi:Sulfite exporter TauE/SafE.